MSLDIADERLAEILGDPTLAAPEEARKVALQISQALPLLTKLALMPDDQLIAVEEGALLLDRSPRWLRENAAQLPFMCKVGDQLRCSKLGIQRFIRQRGSR